MTLDDRDEIYAYLDLVVLPRLRAERHLIRMWTEIARAVRDLGVEIPFGNYFSDPPSDDMTKFVRFVAFYIESRGLNNFVEFYIESRGLNNE